MDIVLEMGVGAVRWTMPSTVHRLETLTRSSVHGYQLGGAYALAAGLPAGYLRDMGLTGRPSLDADTVMDALLERQGCTPLHLQRAVVQAHNAITTWFNEASADTRGNSTGGPGDTPKATPESPTPPAA